MEEKTILPFPYEYEELEPEEKAIIKKLFKSPHVDYVKVGPQKYNFFREYLKGAADIYNMPVRPDDIFVISFQRSGTTLTQELVWLVANDLDYDTAAKTSIAERYPFLDIFMTFNANWRRDFLNSIEDEDSRMKAEKLLECMGQPVTRKLLTAPSPRFIKTHVPLALLPPKLLDTAKVVYVARDPRDVAVSSYHMSRLFKVYDFGGTFKDYWNLFIRDLASVSPFFTQVIEAWEQRHHPNMLFLFYEEITKDMPSTIHRVAKFLGKELSAEQVEQLGNHLQFDNFKANKAVNYEGLREYSMMSPDEAFIRKGKSGGWREYFDKEMAQEAEQWIMENLRDTDLRFPSMDLDI